jgi:protein-S-isoprenylcysteine O-methyltransferase Ste14
MVNNIILFIINIIILSVFSYIDAESHQNFNRKTNLLFHIIGISAVVISFAFLVVSQFEFTLLIYLGAIISIFGIILIIISYVQIKNQFLNAKKIVNKGLYKYSRHPMYLGFIMLLMGISFFSSSLLVLVYSIIFSILLIWQAYEEEKNMIRRFPRYKEYQRKVPMILPRKRKL